MDDKSEEVLKDFRIPDYILVPGSKVKTASHIPSSPVIAFINTKSGGQLGGELLITYRSLLNKNQVIFFLAFAEVFWKWFWSYANVSELSGF